MTDRDELLDIAEAAAFLNVSETSLRRWTNAGTLRHLRVGRRRERRFRRADLLAFMEHASGRAGEDRSRTEEQRSSIIIDGGTVPLGSHRCAFYSSEAGCGQLAARFLAGGLRPGSACFILGSRRVRNAVLTEVDAVEGSVKGHIEAGTILLASYAKSPDAQLDYWEAQFRDAQERGVRSMRVIGDVTEFGERIGGQRLGEYEDDYSLRISSVFPVVTLCLYDVRKFSGRDLFRALRGHPHTAREPLERWLA